MRAHLILSLILLAATPVAYAGNFAECLLDKLPGVRSNQATTASLRICLDQHPGGWSSVEQGAGRGAFADYDSGDECTLELAKETTDRQAGFLIAKSCKQLYDKPTFIPYSGEVITEQSQIDKFLDSSTAVPAEKPKGVLPDEFHTRHSPPPTQPSSTPLTSEMADVLLGNPSSQQACEIKPVMTDADYRACNITPPGQ